MSYRKGENLSCCPVCGKQYYAGDFKLRWDGLYVCRYDYEERHPQDFVRGKSDNMRPAIVAGPNDEFDIAPPIPECVTITEISPGASSVSISWDAVAYAESYDVRVFTFGTPMVPPMNVEGTSFVWPGLPEAPLSVMVNARNESGVGSVGIATSGQGIPGCEPAPLISFSSAIYNASVFDSEIVLTVTRAGGLGVANSVDIDLTDGTAVSPTDYAALSQTLTFEIGETSKPVNVTLVPADYDAEVLATGGGPWAYWKLNEASGTTAADSSGNNRPLEQVLGVTGWGQPTLNATNDTSVLFGSGKRLDREPTGLVGHIDITVEGWAKIDALTAWTQRFFSVGGITSDVSGNTNWQFSIGVGAAGFLEFFWEYDVGVNEIVITSLAPTLGEEFYFVMGRRISDQMVFASLNGSDYEFLPYVNPPDGGSDIRIEVGNHRSDDTPLVGLMSHVVVYTEVVQPDRYERWKIGAERSFFGVLTNPTNGALLGIDEAEIILST